MSNSKNHIHTIIGIKNNSDIRYECLSCGRSFGNKLPDNYDSFDFLGTADDNPQAIQVITEIYLGWHTSKNNNYQLVKKSTN